MSKREKTISDRGLFKEKVQTALYKNDDIKELLLGDLTGKSQSEIRDEFKDHVKSHLFIDDTIEETGSFIYYDIALPFVHPNIKTCQLTMYIIVHRAILEDGYKEGYHGNRADILAEMVQDTLINDDKVCRDFGIGPMEIYAVYPYNSRRFYGVQIIFEVPNFR